MGEPLRVHDAAEAGYGRAAGVYERARPSFPDEAVDWLLDPLGGGEIVEIGAGTGKLTAALVARGVRVVAVEPVAAMRARLSELGPAVTPVDAVAEDLPFDDGAVRSIVASQSLHWTDVERALREFDRVLARGGGVGLVWNFRDLDVPWQRELDDLLAELRGDAPHSRDGRWQRAVDASVFSIVDARTWRWSLVTDMDGVLDRVRSVSYVAARTEVEQEGVDARARAVLVRHGVGGPRVAFPYVTEAYVLQRVERPAADVALP